MSQKRTAERRSESAEDGLSRAQSALPGRGGLARIMAAFWNSLGGLQEGLSTESAIKQEAAIACLLLPFTFFIARDLWTWVALVLNTAIERLCNHIHPDRHEGIRITKDLASAGVFFALALAALVWIAALLGRFGLLIGAWG